jgi:MFS superfamily sulfate permease-like transporter
VTASPAPVRSRTRLAVLSSLPLFSSLRGYRRTWLAADGLAALALVAIAVPSQLATSRLAGMPPVTGLYAFVAGTVMVALLGSNPQMSVGADSTIAPLFAVGVAHLALTGSPRYVALVGLVAVLVGVLVALVGILRLGWIAEFLSDPIVTGFLAGVAVIIIVSQLSDLLGLPPTSGSTLHRIGEVISHLPETNGWTLAIGVGVFVVIAVARRVDRRLPGAFVGLIGSAVLAGVLDLQAHGVAVLGSFAHTAPRFGLWSCRGLRSAASCPSPPSWRWWSSSNRRPPPVPPQIKAGTTSTWAAILAGSAPAMSSPAWPAPSPSTRVLPAPLRWRRLADGHSWQVSGLQRWSWCSSQRLRC